MNSENNSYSGQGQQHSRSELFSDAKVVADAAQSIYRHDTDKMDKTKVADAAGDLLDAAGQYGKLDDKGVGKYLDQAADYLHGYSSNTGSTGGNNGRSGSGSGGNNDGRSGGSYGGNNDGRSGGSDYGSSGGYDSGDRSERRSGGNNNYGDDRSGSGYGDGGRSGSGYGDGGRSGSGYGDGGRSGSGYGNERDGQYGGDNRDGRSSGGYGYGN